MGLSGEKEAENGNVQKVDTLIMYPKLSLIYRTFWNHHSRRTLIQISFLGQKVKESMNVLNWKKK